MSIVTGMNVEEPIVFIVQVDVLLFILFLDNST